MLSWRVRVLPFLEQQQLYDQFKHDEPWDSEHNKALLSKMPDCFKVDDGQVAGAGMTTLMANGGPGGIISKPKGNGRRSYRGISYGQIPDGSSNTLLMINVPDSMAVEWTKPVEFAPDDTALKLILSNRVSSLFADGSTRTIPEGISVEKFKTILTRNGGERIDHTEFGAKY